MSGVGNIYALGLLPVCVRLVAPISIEPIRVHLLTERRVALAIFSVGLVFGRDGGATSGNQGLLATLPACF